MGSGVTFPRNRGPGIRVRSGRRACFCMSLLVVVGEDNPKVGIFFFTGVRLAFATTYFLDRRSLPEDRCFVSRRPTFFFAF